MHRKRCPVCRPVAAVSSVQAGLPDIRIIASDVDGTLLNSRQQLSPRVEAAVKRAESQGVPVRAHPACVASIPALGWSLSFHVAKPSVHELLDLLLGVSTCAVVHWWQEPNQAAAAVNLAAINHCLTNCVCRNNAPLWLLLSIDNYVSRLAIDVVLLSCS